MDVDVESPCQLDLRSDGGSRRIECKSLIPTYPHKNIFEIVNEPPADSVLERSSEYEIIEDPKEAFNDNVGIGIVVGQACESCYVEKSKSRPLRIGGTNSDIPDIIDHSQGNLLGRVAKGCDDSMVYAVLRPDVQIGSELSMLDQPLHLNIWSSYIAHNIVT